jgi:uncharacterized protein YuzE
MAATGDILQHGKILAIEPVGAACRMPAAQLFIEASLACILAPK